MVAPCAKAKRTETVCILVSILVSSTAKRTPIRTCQPRSYRAALILPDPFTPVFLPLAQLLLLPLLRSLLLDDPRSQLPITDFIWPVQCAQLVAKRKYLHPRAT
ncbi:GD24829 [Drosophila simulans]|uniref:GD24829 n=1 Tax=Drosophila simulans TaxID=7240 RepID=B4NUI4_DROSI|nr:GD24829 [Drosophila simulans]